LGGAPGLRLRVEPTVRLTDAGVEACSAKTLLAESLLGLRAVDGQLLRELMQSNTDLLRHGVVNCDLLRDLPEHRDDVRHRALLTSQQTLAVRTLYEWVLQERILRERSLSKRGLGERPLEIRALPEGALRKPGRLRANGLAVLAQSGVLRVETEGVATERPRLPEPRLSKQARAQLRLRRPCARKSGKLRPQSLW
jgi:hypothetical protein